MQDGLLEIFLGLYLTILGVVMIVWIKWISIPTFLLPFLCYFFIKYVKKRLIYPRMGYASLNSEEESHPWITLSKKLPGIVGVTSLFLLLAAATIPLFQWFLGKNLGWNFWSLRFFPAIYGIVLAIGPVTLASQYQSPRWLSLGIICIISGIVIPFFYSLSFYEILGRQIFLIGIISTIMGAIVFIRFLRMNPFPPEDIAHEI
ncbi:MAG: hypothetical protein AB1656_23830 [Candidatus Omnitrophota bacterium]